MHRSTPDLPVAHTSRELSLCRDDNSKLLLTSVEMSKITEYVCMILYLKTLIHPYINVSSSAIIVMGFCYVSCFYCFKYIAFMCLI